MKIDLPAIITLVLFAGLIFLFLIPGFERVMMERKRNMIREMTSTAYSLLEYYHSLEEDGEISDSTARDQASEAISKLRYGEQLKDYFWITDRHPTMIVHPYRSDLNGKDLTDFHDSKGKTVFVEFVKAVETTGESFVDYMWQWNDDSTKIVPKLSYVRLYEPWDWIIGTGIYIEDVRLEIRRIETLALIVSGIIAMIIILLLILISRQSHRIETERSRAEDELRKSKELYRTLAEAASEGVLIWSKGILQANKTMLEWLGYNDEELKGLAIHDIINASELSAYHDSDSLYQDLAARLSVDFLIRLKNGSHVESHADLSRIEFGGLKAVLIVVRPAKTFTSKNEFSLSSTLMDHLRTGLFRITYGRKNRFLTASLPTLEMLGFNNIKELRLHPVEAFFANRFEFKSFRNALAARQIIQGKIVLLRRSNDTMFRALINAVVVETDTGDIWCEGSIEYITGPDLTGAVIYPDLKEFSAAYISEIPVSEIMKPSYVCYEKSKVTEALTIMKEKNASNLVVLNEFDEPAGLIETTTILAFLAEGGSSESRVSDLALAAPVMVSNETRINSVINLFNTYPVKCIIVTSGEKTVSGIVTPEDLLKAFRYSPRILFREIENAVSATALKSVYLSSRKICISMLIGHADPASVVTFLSSVADAICRKAIDMSIRKLGPPPCKYTFIQTGSAGRMEQSFLTDQDNAIIFEDPPGGDPGHVASYFRTLGKMVNEILDQSGYRRCKGGNMAGNEKWCQPLSMWKKYFSGWIKTPGPEEILEVSIFFDFRFCHGDPSLSDELREYINDDLRTSDIYFHHMASGWKQFNPSIRDLERKKTDIKKLIMPVTGIIRLYALKEGISDFSTIDRIIELYSTEKYDHRLLYDTITAWKDLMSVRLTHQALCINKGIDPDNLVDFRMEARELFHNAEQAVESVNNLVLKALSDFYVDTI